MKIWLENGTDIKEHYWLYKEGHVNERAILSTLRVISINGESIFSEDEQKSFRKISGKKILELLKPLCGLNYKLNIICVKTITDKASKIQNYKKIWKYLKEECDLSKFELSEEIMIEGKYYNHFYGIAQTDLDNINEAIEMISIGSAGYILTISDQQNYLHKNKLFELSNLAFLKDKKVIEVNYLNLCEYACTKGEIVVRWGKDSLGAEIDLVYNPDHINIVE